MFEKIRRLTSYERPALSMGLVLMGIAVMVWAASCSQNGGPMADKKGEREAHKVKNGPETGHSWRRIIVRLNVPGIQKMKNEAAMLKDPAAASAMDQNIAAQIAVVADKVLAKLKAAEATLIRRYDTLPLLALKASPKAVMLLEAMPEVQAIEADHLLPPMGQPAKR